ncbi:ComEC/Rec2 family competence protein [Synechococcus elongatus IITB4]|uniref:ComEC/Rec2 family competence protein n=1 Tax=Synechococcus elongatus TaxID=32046 RepID=UPI0030CF3652
MAPTAVYLCCAFAIAGFFLASQSPLPVGWVFAGLVWAAIAIAGYPLLPRSGQRRFSSRIWLWAAIALYAAGFWFYLRLPTPSAIDISRWADQGSGVLVGTISDRPRLQAQGQSFTLTAQTWSPNPSETTLKLPPSQGLQGQVAVRLTAVAEGLQPGQTVVLEGELRSLQALRNPAGFDRQRYLQRQSVFSEFRGQLLKEDNPPFWSLEPVRRRILAAFQQGLGKEQSSALAALSFGNGLARLPGTLPEDFLRCGLAHATAASGFQVALLLGLTLACCRSLSPRWQAAIGTLTLISFLGIAGSSASLLRAFLMGEVQLWALLRQRSPQTLPTLLLVATALLLWQPLWIEDLGFQFSFLATLGLIVSVQPITDRLDWLPPRLAVLIAVPLAATIWTLPLQLHAFGTLSPYAIPANVLVTPLLAILGIGGVWAGLLSLIWLPLGSVAAWLLGAPLWLLISIVSAIANLPGATWATGQIAMVVVLLCYLSYALLLTWPRLRRRWRSLAVALIAIVLLPGLAQAATQQEILFLSSDGPLAVVRDRGQVGLVCGASDRSLRWDLQPYLEQQGINQLDWVLQLSDRCTVQEQWPIRQIFSSQSLQPGQAIQWPNLKLQWLSRTPNLWQLSWQGEQWLWLFQRGSDRWSLRDLPPLPSQAWLWSASDRLPRGWLPSIQIKGWISSSTTPTSLQSSDASTRQPDGRTRHQAWRWTPNGSLQSAIAQTSRPGLL